MLVPSTTSTRTRAEPTRPQLQRCWLRSRSLRSETGSSLFWKDQAQRQHERKDLTFWKEGQRPGDLLYPCIVFMWSSVPLGVAVLLGAVEMGSITVSLFRAIHSLVLCSRNRFVGACLGACSNQEWPRSTYCLLNCIKIYLSFVGAFIARDVNAD